MFFDEGEMPIPAKAQLLIYSDGAHEIHQTDGTVWEFGSYIENFSTIHRVPEPLDGDFSALDVRF